MFTELFLWVQAWAQGWRVKGEKKEVSRGRKIKK